MKTSTTTQKRTKKITIDNYLDFKPSEFVRSFASDLEWGMAESKRTGKPINMYVFTKDKDCLPCLGGLACMNFGTPRGYTFNHKNRMLDNTAVLGDSIRQGLVTVTNTAIKGLYPDYRPCKLGKLRPFNGKYDYDELQPLIDQIHHIADQIERSGQ